MLGGVCAVPVFQRRKTFTKLFYVMVRVGFCGGATVKQRSAKGTGNYAGVSRKMSINDGPAVLFKDS